MTEKRCILVVEGEPLVAETVADALSGSYRTVVVDAAADALEQIRLGGADLILLDYLLPGGGSTQVVAAAEAAGLPVVTMSGFRQPPSCCEDVPYRGGHRSSGTTCARPSIRSTYRTPYAYGY